MYPETPIESNPLFSLKGYPLYKIKKKSPFYEKWYNNPNKLRHFKTKNFPDNEPEEYEPILPYLPREEEDITLPTRWDYIKTEPILERKTYPIIQEQWQFYDKLKHKKIFNPMDLSFKKHGVLFNTPTKRILGKEIPDKDIAYQHYIPTLKEQQRKRKKSKSISYQLKSPLIPIKQISSPQKTPYKDPTKKRKRSYSTKTRIQPTRPRLKPERLGFSYLI